MAKQTDYTRQFLDSFDKTPGAKKPSKTAKKGNFGGGVMRAIGSVIPKPIRSATAGPRRFVGKKAVEAMASTPVQATLRGLSVPSSAVFSGINAGLNTFTQSRVGRAYWGLGRGDEAARFKQRANAAAYAKRGGFAKSTFNFTGAGDVLESVMPTNKDTIKRASKGIFTDKEVSNYLAGKKSPRVSQAVSGDKDTTYKGQKALNRGVGAGLDLYAGIKGANTFKLGIGESATSVSARRLAAKGEVAAAKAEKALARKALEAARANATSALFAKTATGSAALDAAKKQAKARAKEAKAGLKEAKQVQRVVEGRRFKGVVQKSPTNLSRKEIALKLRESGQLQAAELAAKRKYGKITAEQLDAAGLKAGLNIKGLGVVDVKGLGSKTGTVAKKVLGVTRPIGAVGDALKSTAPGEAVARAMERVPGAVDTERDFGKSARWATEAAVVANRRAEKGAARSWERAATGKLSARERRFVAMAKNGPMITDALENPTKAAALEKRMPGLLGKLREGADEAFQAQEKNLGKGNIAYRKDYVPHVLTPKARRAESKGRGMLQDAIRISQDPEAMAARERRLGYKEFLGEKTDGTITSMNDIARRRLGIDYDLFDTSYVAQREATKKSVGKAARAASDAEQALVYNLPGSGKDIRMVDQKKLARKGQRWDALTKRQQRLAKLEKEAAATEEAAKGKQAAADSLLKGVRGDKAKGVKGSGSVVEQVRGMAGTARARSEQAAASLETANRGLVDATQGVADAKARGLEAVGEAEKALQIPVGEKGSGWRGGGPMHVPSKEELARLPKPAEILDFANDKRFAPSNFRQYGDPGIAAETPEEKVLANAYRTRLREAQRKTILEHFEKAIPEGTPGRQRLLNMIKKAKDPTEVLERKSSWLLVLKKGGLPGELRAKFQSDLEVALSRNHVNVVNVVNEKLAVDRAARKAGGYVPEGLQAPIGSMADLKGKRGSQVTGRSVAYTAYPESEELIKIAQRSNPQITQASVNRLRRMAEEGRALTPRQAREHAVLADARVERYRWLRNLERTNSLTEDARQELASMKAFAQRVRIAEGLTEKQLPTSRVYEALSIVARKNRDAVLMGRAAENTLGDVVRFGLEERRMSARYRELKRIEKEGTLTVQQRQELERLGQENVATTSEESYRRTIAARAKRQGKTVEQYLADAKEAARAGRSTDPVAEALRLDAERKGNLAADKAAMADARAEAPVELTPTQSRQLQMAERRLEKAKAEARVANAADSARAEAKVVDAQRRVDEIRAGENLPPEYSASVKMAEDVQALREQDKAAEETFARRRSEGQAKHSEVVKEQTDLRDEANRSIVSAQDDYNKADELNTLRANEAVAAKDRYEAAKEADAKAQARLKALRDKPTPRPNTAAARERAWKLNAAEKKARETSRELESAYRADFRAKALAKSAREDFAEVSKEYKAAVRKNNRIVKDADAAIAKSQKDNVDKYVDLAARREKDKLTIAVKAVADDLKIGQAKVREEFTPEQILSYAQDLRYRVADRQAMQRAAKNRPAFEARIAADAAEREAKDAATRRAEREAARAAESEALSARSNYQRILNRQRRHTELTDKLEAGRKFGDVGGPSLHDVEVIARRVSDEDVPEELRGIVQRLRAGRTPNGTAVQQRPMMERYVRDLRNRMTEQISKIGLSGKMLDEALSTGAVGTEYRAIAKELVNAQHWLDVITPAAEADSKLINDFLVHYKDNIAESVRQKNFADAERLRSAYDISIGKLPEPLREKYVVRDGQILPAAEPLLEPMTNQAMTKSLMGSSAPTKKKGGAGGPKPRLRKGTPQRAAMRAPGVPKPSVSNDWRFDPNRMVPLSQVGELPAVKMNPVPDLPQVDLPEALGPIERPNRRFGIITQPVAEKPIGPMPVRMSPEITRKLDNVQKAYDEAVARSQTARGRVAELEARRASEAKSAVRFAQSARELEQQGQKDAAEAARLAADAATMRSTLIPKAQGKVESATAAYNGIDFMVWKTEIDKGLVRYGNPTKYGQLVLDRDFADAYRLANSYTVRNHGMLMTLADRLMGQWKAMALFSPGFHIRNAFGGIFNNYLAGVSDASYSVFLRNYTRVMRANGDTSVITNPRIRQAFDEMLQRGVMGLGGGENIALGEASRAVGGGRFNPLKRANDLNMKVGSGVEDTLRGTLFLHDFLNGKDANEALQRTIKFHYDTDFLSEGERNIVRRIVPFYSFFRNNMPLQAEMIAKQPGKYIAWQRMFQLASSDQQDPDRPDFRLTPESVRLPWDFAGSPTYMTPQTMITDPLKFTTFGEGGKNPLQELLQLPGPIPQALYEGIAGKKITSNTPYKYMNPVPATGATGALARMFGKVDENGNMSAQTFNNLRRALPLLSYDPIFATPKTWDRDTEKATPDKAKRLEAVSSKLLGMSVYANTPERVAVDRKIKANKAKKAGGGGKVDYTRQFLDGFK